MAIPLLGYVMSKFSMKSDNTDNFVNMQIERLNKSYDLGYSQGYLDAMKLVQHNTGLEVAYLIPESLEDLLYAASVRRKEIESTYGGK